MSKSITIKTHTSYLEYFTMLINYNELVLTGGKIKYNVLYQISI